MEKQDKIITLLETVIEKLDEAEERDRELQESIANLNLPGSGYSIFSEDEEE